MTLCWRTSVFKWLRWWQLERMSKLWVDTVNVLFILGNSIASWDVWLPSSSPGLDFVYERQVSSKRPYRHNLRSKACFWMLVSEDLCNFIQRWCYLLPSSLPLPLPALRVFFSSECAADVIPWDGVRLVAAFSWCDQHCATVCFGAMQDSVAQVQNLPCSAGPWPRLGTMCCALKS